MDVPACTMALAWSARNRDCDDIALLRSIAHTVVQDAALRDTALREEARG
ncbi:hypothetical protein [Streptomyces albiaxialis]